MQKLSMIAEALFDQVAVDLARTRSAANDAITLWPDNVMPGNTGLDFREKARLNDRLTGADHATNTLPYKRLKTAMDAWCALWLWPLDKVELLPSRAEFLQGMAMIVEGGFTADGSLAAPSVIEFADPNSDFFDRLEPETPAGDLFKDAKRRQEGLFRETNVEALVESFDWLQVAAEVAERERFVHFDLIFADVMNARGGFDLIVGNPPWAKPSWNEGLVLADIDPLYAGLSASDAKKVLPEALPKAPPVRREGRLVPAVEAFLHEFVSTRGAMEVTSSEVMNPFAGGGSNNLYRCFIDLSFRLVAPDGYAALIHQDGHLRDPDGFSLRESWYGRISKHFEFSNKITSKNFSEVRDQRRFSMNVYRGAVGPVNFEQFTNAFLASQIEDSYSHDGAGKIPAIKNSDGKWDTRGHLHRLVTIDEPSLKKINSLSEPAGTPILRTRFIQPFSANTLEVFERMALAPKLDSFVKKQEKGGDTLYPSSWQASGCWHESGAQKSGIIRQGTKFRPAAESIIQGPIFYDGNPLNKTPRERCSHNSHYDCIDLQNLPENYVPRTNFGPSISIDDYRSNFPICRWDSTRSHCDFFRVALRRRVPLNSERSLTATIIPPDIAHIDSVQSISFSREENVLDLSAALFSIPLDFLIKSSGLTDIYDADIARFPWVECSEAARQRVLRLVCITEAYATLWNKFRCGSGLQEWASDDPRLNREGPFEGPVTWDRSAALRTEFARRLALVEIDVLVAQALGLNLEQLIEIYRIYFPVLQVNEAGTWYDQNGRIVWTCSKGLPGVGWLDDRGKSPGRAAWEKILAENPSELICTAVDDTLPGGPRTVARHFIGPFTRCDRIEDYERAWAHFEQHIKEVAA